MEQDRITQVRIEGLRCVKDVTLSLGHLTVLIGENGTGKSTILEALEILRHAAADGFLAAVNGIHGGMFSLLRAGERRLALGARLEAPDHGPRYDYRIVLEQTDPMSTVRIAAEILTFDRPAGRSLTRLIERDGDDTRIHSKGGMQPIPVHPHQTALASIGALAPHPGFAWMRETLAGIQVHLPFEVLPGWAARAHQRRSDMRTPSQLQPAARLDRLGTNLANVFHSLRTEHGDAHWQTTMDYVRLGLGDTVESVNARTDPGGGAIGLWLKVAGQDAQLPASVLSDGTLAYLAFVAMCRLPVPSSLVAFDEPDIHLHPALLARVVALFDALAAERPVLLTTHSDRLLDALPDPVASVRVCQIEDPGGGTVLRSLDARAYEEWVEQFRGVGDLRGAGHLGRVLMAKAPPA